MLSVGVDAQHKHDAIYQTMNELHAVKKRERRERARARARINDQKVKVKVGWVGGCAANLKSRGCVVVHSAEVSLVSGANITCAVCDYDIRYLKDLKRQRMVLVGAQRLQQTRQKRCATDL